MKENKEKGATGENEGTGRLFKSYMSYADCFWKVKGGKGWRELSDLSDGRERSDRETPT